VVRSLLFAPFRRHLLRKRPPVPTGLFPSRSTGVSATPEGTLFLSWDCSHPDLSRKVTSDGRAIGGRRG
jgi:hypothetical protein